MQRLLLILFTFLFSSFINGQILTESNLPIIIINTEDEIPDEPKIEGTMGIIFNGEGLINNVNDPLNHYYGNIRIETRGNSTQGFDKKTYSLETQDDAFNDFPVSLLGMGGDEDWILHAMVIDKSQLRIPMCFDVFRDMGHYAANWRYVELIVNEEYRGLYILTEKIKRDDDRVDIAALNEDDIEGDELTGGYILRIDWIDDYQGFFSEYDSQSGDEMLYQWYYPKAENIQPEQAAYIENAIGEFEQAVFSEDFTNDEGIRYTEMIDVNSFTDFLIINEFAKNSDGYKLSSYLHKRKDSDGGEIVAGPIWDFDQTFGLSTVCSSDFIDGWTYLQNQPDCGDLESMPMFWQAMMSDTVFTNYLACRYDHFRTTTLHEDSLFTWIDSNESWISDAIERNFIQWDNFIGEEIWIEPYPFPETYEEEVQYLKDYISARLNWLDANMPGGCSNNVLNVMEHNPEYLIDVFPNPANEELTITTNRAGRLEVFSADGRLVERVDNQSNKYNLNIASYSPGVYVLRFIVKENVIQKQFIVR